jgi:hypothetical protein
MALPVAAILGRKGQQLKEKGHPKAPLSSIFDEAADQVSAARRCSLAGWVASWICFSLVRLTWV